MKTVTLYDILTIVTPDQKLYIYYENAYGQYACLYRGRRIDIKFDEEYTWPDESVFEHLNDTVLSIKTESNKLRVFIRDDKYDMRLEESYCTPSDKWCYYADLSKKFEWL